MSLRSAGPVVCVLTSGAARSPEDAAASRILELARLAAAAGVDLLQLRERSLNDADLFTLARRVVAAVDRRRTRVLVNERADVAIAAGAAGVHLRATGMPASRVRAVAPAGFLIGRSVHSEVEARRAEADNGADFLFFGTVYPSDSKGPNHPTAGIRALGEVCAAVALPVIAVGGIDQNGSAAVAAAGAAGVAGIGMFERAAAGGETGMRGLVDDLRRALGARPRPA